MRHAREGCGGADGGGVKPVTENEGLIYFYYTWSPDSRWIAVSLGEPTNFRSIWIWSAEDGKLTRVTDEFLRAVEADREWALTERTTGKVARTVSAAALWDRIAEAAWHSADPGVQFDTTINPISTTLYAFMQSTGMVNDHILTCFRHAECAKLQKKLKIADL